MGKIFRKMQRPIDLPDSVAPVKVLRELSVLSGNSCADEVETNSLVNESIVK